MDKESKEKSINYKKIIGCMITLILCVVIIVITVIFIQNNQREPIQKPVNKRKWTLTQYGDNEGKQMMCYTIEGEKNGLVIIDGGYKDNEEQHEFLKEKILEHENIVDAWIVTHFDGDHGGLFVKMVQDPEITIKTAYVQNPPTDMDLLKEKYPEEDDWSTYEEYLTLDIPQAVKVQPGEKFQFIGLKMEVLSVYEDWMREKVDNLLNNGSIVFKIKGKEESLLFCGDIQHPILGKYLLENYSKKLKADYLQVPHHGNNYMGADFYKAVSPKIALFSAPDWLMDNTYEVPWYTVKENKMMLEALGAECYWYNTSPNIFTFQ